MIASGAWDPQGAMAVEALSPRLRALPVPTSDADDVTAFLKEHNVVTLIDAYGASHTRVAGAMFCVCAQTAAQDHASLDERYFFLDARRLVGATSWTKRRRAKLCLATEWNAHLLVINNYDHPRRSTVQMFDHLLHWRTSHRLPTVITTTSLHNFEYNVPSVRDLVNNGVTIDCDLA